LFEYPCVRSVPAGQIAFPSGVCNSAQEASTRQITASGIDKVPLIHCGQAKVLCSQDDWMARHDEHPAGNALGYNEFAMLSVASGLAPVLVDDTLS
jgi:hypothetical protein